MSLQVQRIQRLRREKAEPIVAYEMTAQVDAAKLPFPQIIDLFVPEALRSQELGTSILGRMERLASNAGFDKLYLCVDPINNTRVYDLYIRLGYQPLRAEPYHGHWRFTDSDDNVHEGDGWALDMVKAVT